MYKSLGCSERSAGVFGVPDDPCLDPFGPGGKVAIVVESLAERGESNATLLSRRGVV
jgi:hypothetical protein